jgi:hypothetical protein
MIRFRVDLILAGFLAARSTHERHSAEQQVKPVTKTNFTID